MSTGLGFQTASAADMVTVTLTTGGCAGPFRPRVSVVCIQGANSTPQCTQARDDATAEVYATCRLGLAYTATGKGLGTEFSGASEPNCQLLGPITAVL